LPRYAVIKNSEVVNIIEAPESAPLSMLVPEADDFIEETDQTGTIYIGGKFSIEVGKFKMPAPYPSWIWHENLFSWEPPKAHPGQGILAYWDEEAIEWVIIDSI
jgi:hypothetical protein